MEALPLPWGNLAISGVNKFFRRDSQSCQQSAIVLKIRVSYDTRMYGAGNQCAVNPQFS